MKTNEFNEVIYKKCFTGWNIPCSIDESDVDNYCNKINENGEEIWIPATPLGCRDYLESRKEGIEKIIDYTPALTFDLDHLHTLKKGEEPFKLYDHLSIPDTEKDFVVSAEKEDRFFIVDRDNHLYYIEYKTL